jgi:hypothetical protein
MGRLAGLGWAAALVVAVAASALAATKPGGAGADRLRGTKSADVLRGRGGADILLGRQGDDVLIGGRGRDKLKGGPGHDGFNVRRGVEIPAPGRDVIRARDGKADEINCGAGRDLATVDAVEGGVFDCEQLRVPK